MEKYDIYKDISQRTGGDIFIGVVGPVRTGKSTFISKFMEQLVLPNINNKLAKQIATDEMPQSADGKTIMTTQPKFIPANSVKVQFKNKATASIRLVDCVGYMVEGATGHIEDKKPRLVKTPWSEEEIPFEKAAEIGTEKVIKEYSTIGIVVTTDGSVCDIAREGYVLPEEKVINELKSLRKPFVVILNSKNPNSPETIKLCDSLEEKYEVSVICKNVSTLKAEDFSEIMEKVLFEFPMCNFNVSLPKWMQALPVNNALIQEIISNVKEKAENMAKMKDFAEIVGLFEENENFNSPEIVELKLGEGECDYNLNTKEGLFYRVLSKECNDTIEDDYQLINFIKTFAEEKRKYEKIKTALQVAESDGYGVVLPTMEEMNLEEPVLVKQGGRYGVKLRASAPSLHIMKVDVSSEVSPIVGTEKQGEDLVNYLMGEFKDNPNGIWQTNLFGKSLHDLMNEGLSSKLNAMPKEAQGKMRKTLTRIVNENKGGIICILL